MLASHLFWMRLSLASTTPAIYYHLDFSLLHWRDNLLLMLTTDSIRRDFVYVCVCMDLRLICHCEMSVFFDLILLPYLNNKSKQFISSLVSVPYHTIFVSLFLCLLLWISLLHLLWDSSFFVLSRFVMLSFSHSLPLCTRKM